MNDDADAYGEAAREAGELGNRTADEDTEEDLWDIADGLLAGAIQYWLYAHQPCGDPLCEDCEPMSTAEARLAEMLRLAKEFAADSEYFHSPNDSNVGRA